MAVRLGETDHEILHDDELIGKLDEAHKWELLTDDADFDTHYHTLREALGCVQRMSEENRPVHAVSKLDGTVFVDTAQLTRLLTRLGMKQPTESPVSAR